jgi:predicted amidophosphoribosyltransferase
MLKKLYKYFSQIAFPPICVHCEGGVEGKGLLCIDCMQNLTLLSAEGRCSTCFDEVEICGMCRGKSYPFRKAAAVFEYFGPAFSLLQLLKKGSLPSLAKDFAAFMVVQLFQLGWPLPDQLVPMPQSFAKTLQNGYNLSELIAKEMAKLLQCPCDCLLKRKNIDLSFSWKKRRDLANKTILLIDEQIDTKDNLCPGATILQEGAPRSIYVLAAAWKRADGF